MGIFGVFLDELPAVVFCEEVHLFFPELVVVGREDIEGLGAVLGVLFDGHVGWHGRTGDVFELCVLGTAVSDLKIQHGTEVEHLNLLVLLTSESTECGVDEGLLVCVSARTGGGLGQAGEQSHGGREESLGILALAAALQGCGEGCLEPCEQSLELRARELRAVEVCREECSVAACP